MIFSTLNTRSTIIVTAILTTCLIILVFQFQPTNHPQSNIPCYPRHNNKRPDDFGFGATHLTTDTLFTSNKLLLSFSHKFDDKVTGRLLPKKTGLIWTKYNDTLRLPMGIAMFHAMHCLLYLREVFQDGLEVADTSSSTYRLRGGEVPLAHIPHCFSYITQHVMCLGDSTIEPAWTDMDEAGNIKAFGIDGLGIHHKCKDMTRMIEIARRTQTETFDAWDWKDGDTVESVFGS